MENERKNDSDNTQENFSEERNNETAEKYHQLGLADYAALEAFKRYHY